MTQLPYQAPSSNSLLPTDPLLTARESAAHLQISVPTFWRRVSDGTVPQPIKLGGLSRWPRSEIQNVIEKAKSKRNVT